jgi:hypothetical protein
LSRKQKFSNSDLWNIVQNHKSEFTSVGSWNRYAKEKGLPHSQTFIQRLGSWNEIKQQLNLEANGQHRPTKYNQEELMGILVEHKELFKNIYSWNQFASKNKLPSAEVFVRHLGMDEVEKVTGYKSNLENKDLKDLILKHFPHTPPTVNQWKMLSKHELELPSFSTIIRKFESWKKMKREVYCIKKHR